MDSVANSALMSRQASRASTPIMINHHQHHQFNPYRLPRFWRGYALGGLTTAGAYGLYKLGSFIRDLLNNKFQRQYLYAYNTYASPPPTYNTPPALPKSTPTPTPKPKPFTLHHNRHK